MRGGDRAFGSLLSRPITKGGSVGLLPFFEIRTPNECDRD